MIPTLQLDMEGERFRKCYKFPFISYFNRRTRLKIYLNYFVDIIVVPLRVDAAVGGVRWGVRGANTGWWVVYHMLHDDPLNMGVTRVTGSGRELGGVGPLHHYGGSAP